MDENAQTDVVAVARGEGEERIRVQRIVVKDAHGAVDPTEGDEERAAACKAVVGQLRAAHAVPVLPAHGLARACNAVQPEDGPEAAPHRREGGRKVGVSV